MCCPLVQETLTPIEYNTRPSLYPSRHPSPLILHGIRAWVPNPNSGDGGWLVVLAGDCLRGEGLCGRRRGGIPDLRGGGSREVESGEQWLLEVASGVIQAWKDGGQPGVGKGVGEAS